MNYLLTQDSNMVNDMIGARVIQIRKEEQKRKDKYTNYIGFQFAIDELDLFDDIQFKYLGNRVCHSYQHNHDLEVLILDMDVDEEDSHGLDKGCKTIIKFELDNPEFSYNGDNFEIPQYLKYEKIYEYSPSSRLAIEIFDSLIEERSDDECSDSDEE